MDTTKKLQMKRKFESMMNFIMENELRFTNELISKSFILLAPERGEGESIEFTDVDLDIPETEAIESIDEGIRRLMETYEQVEWERMKCEDKGHETIAVQLTRVFDMGDDTCMVYVLFKDWIDGPDKPNGMIEIHRLAKGRMRIRQDGRVRESKSRMEFNHA